MSTETDRDYEKLVERLNTYSAEYQRHSGITAEAADAIKALLSERDAAQKEAQDLQIQWDMYGGGEGVAVAFQKAEERDAAIEDLRGLCWCCAHGEKYENGLPWSRATTCEHMRELGVVARSGGKCKCQFWQWRGQKGENNDQTKL